MSTDDNDTEAQKGYLKRLVSIPCMRDSLMYGISGGLGVGLTHFLLTSNVSRATNVGFGGYLVIMFGTWGFCRYKYMIARHNAQQWQKTQQSGAGNIKLIDPKDV